MSVALVGAGPGDPDLITRRGLRLIQECQVLVYDRLVGPELVAEAPVDAILVDRDGIDQDEVNDLLVDYGRLGLRVVRLKGGDPFVFGRGGEEALVLRAAGIEVEVVPGVSSFAAVPAAAGIPVTHRGLSQEATIVMGHDADLDYARLAANPGTLVVFMGARSLPRIAEGLLAAGKHPDTPAAVIANGTRGDQEVVTSVLSEIAEAAAGVPTPALIVIGEVVALAGAIGPAQRHYGAAVALGARIF